MDDLIRRQEAIVSVLYAKDDLDAERLIKSLPSAQPEIIRCKDCKWYDIFHPYGTVMPDAFHCKMNDRFYDTRHYCAYGERRD